MTKLGKALIIGAGIGGLTTAIALKERGFEPVVFERAPRDRGHGTTLVLWPNALRILQRWRLADDIIAMGVRNVTMSVRTMSGKKLYELPLHSLENKYGFPVVTILRSDLHSLLIDRLGEGHIHWGQEFESAEQDDQQVRAHFTNGDSVEGELMIGADGIYSKVRPIITGNVALRDCGYVAYRGMVNHLLPDLPRGEGIEFWGRGRRFGLFPTGNQGVYWFATMNAQGSQGRQKDSPYYRKEELLAEFANWSPSVRLALEQTEPSSIVRHPILDLPTIGSLTKGRIAILGDAAHAMTPNLGQGACQAIEDSGALGDCLQVGNNVGAALLQYEKLRLARVQKIVALSYRMGWVSQWSNPVLCSIRNTVFSAVPSFIKLIQVGRIID